MYHPLWASSTTLCLSKWARASTAYLSTVPFVSPLMRHAPVSKILCDFSSSDTYLSAESSVSQKRSWSQDLCLHHWSSSFSQMISYAPWIEFYQHRNRKSIINNILRRRQLVCSPLVYLHALGFYGATKLQFVLHLDMPFFIQGQHIFNRCVCLLHKYHLETAS